MRTLRRNKQSMKYARTDKKISRKRAQIDNNGKTVWVETGEKISVLGEPIEFKASINNKLKDADMQPFGLDLSNLYLQIVAKKGLLPLKEGDAIWKKSEVRTKNLYGEEVTDETSCDYTVKMVADEGIDVDLFLLQRNVK